jgi:hypothetical protein
MINTSVALGLLLLACESTSTAEGLVVDVDVDLDLEMAVTANPNHPLSALVTVTSSDPVQIDIVFHADGTRLQRTGRSAQGTEHSFTLIGMRAETLYSVQANATGPTGDTAVSDQQTVLTGSLPEDIVPVTVEVSDSDRVQPGFTLLGPMSSSVYAMAVDEAGEVVWFFQDLERQDEVTDIRDATLLPNGNVHIQLYTTLYVVSPDGQPEIYVETETEYPFGSHEVVALENGNFLGIYGEYREVDGVELRGEGIVELNPLGEAVWVWSLFDHLDTTRFPGEESMRELSNGALDWTHANALQYLEDEQAILITVRNQNLLMKVDHGTGEVIWSFGENADFSLTEGSWFYSPHGGWMAQDGRLSIYDNGNDRPVDDRFSRGVVYELDPQEMTARQTWEYKTENYTGHFGNVDFLDNGNFLVAAGGPNGIGPKPTAYEVTPDGDLVWKLETTETTDDDKTHFYRTKRVGSFYPGVVQD